MSQAGNFTKVETNLSDNIDNIDNIDSKLDKLCLKIDRMQWIIVSLLVISFFKEEIMLFIS